MKAAHHNRHAPTPPICCGSESRMTTGREVYAHRSDLKDRIFWICDHCGAFCGSHRHNGEPLGYPAGPELRRARSAVHALLDPIWRTAWTLYKDGEQNRKKICGVARRRVYDFLGARLGLDREECHTAMFDLDQCRRAQEILAGRTYFEIREWSKSKKKGNSGCL